MRVETAVPVKNTAKIVARRTETQVGGGRMKVYRCSWCDWYHFGHPPNREAIEQRAR